MILEAFLLSLNCVVILLILGGAGYVTAGTTRAPASCLRAS